MYSVYQKISESEEGVVVEGNLDLSYCHNLKSLGNLVHVKGNLRLKECGYLKSLGNLKEVDKSLDMISSGVEDLGDLESVGGYLYLSRNVTSLKNLEYVGTQLFIYNKNITDLGKLRHVGKAIHGYYGDTSKYPQFKFEE